MRDLRNHVTSPELVPGNTGVEVFRSAPVVADGEKLRSRKRGQNRGPWWRSAGAVCLRRRCPRKHGDYRLGVGQTRSRRRMLLCRRCMEVQNSSMLAIGGSDDTLRLLPKVRWFVPQTDMEWYAKPLKPWRRFLRSARDMRDVLKFFRNAGWKFLSSLPSPGKWTCRLALADDPVFTPAGDFVPILRTRVWIDYLSACPAAKCRLWILTEECVPRGHALISNLGGSARVADFALDGEQTAETATQAFSALIRALERDDSLLEIVAASSLVQDIHAFRACGLRYRRKSAILLADIGKKFPPNSTLEIKPLLADQFYLYDPSNPFQL